MNDNKIKFNAIQEKLRNISPGDRNDSVAKLSRALYMRAICCPCSRVITFACKQCQDDMALIVESCCDPAALKLERALIEHREGRLAALEKLAKVTQCAEEMLKCFDVNEHGPESDWAKSDNEPWDDRCNAACEAMKRAIDE